MSTVGCRTTTRLPPLVFPKLIRYIIDTPVYESVAGLSPV